MSVGGYGNGGIVTDGLIFSVDPYNTKSYVSGGTVYDLTVNRYTGETVNGPIYDNSWSMDGTNQKIEMNTGFGLLQPSLPITIDLWFKLGNSAPANSGLINLDYNALAGDIDYYGAHIQYASNSSLGLSLGDGVTNGVTSRRTLITPNNSLTVDKWCHICAIFRDAVTYDITCYIDLVDVGGTNSGTGAAVDWSSSSDSRTTIGQNWGPGTGFIDGSISQIKVYNKELSIEEITQNYNALKWRFR